MKLSIIIPAYNEEKYLPRLLKSISSQPLAVTFEVIVADAHSTDSTKMIAKAFGTKVITARQGLPAYARNAGARAASGEILLFLDADVVLPKEFLRKALTEFSKKKLDSAGCYFRPDNNKIFDRIIIEGVANAWCFAFQKIWPQTIGCCIFIKKKLHEKIRGFDETITFGEDAAYIKESAKAGGKFGILTGLKIPFSMRRMERDGRLRLALKSGALILQRIGGEIRRDVNYKFGNY